MPRNHITSEMTDVVAVLDNNLCFLSHSENWHSLFHIEDSNIIGKFFYDVMQDSPVGLENLNELCCDGEKETAFPACKHIKPDGRVSWLKWRINPWINGDGETGGLFITIEDITALKRNEEVLTLVGVGSWEIDFTTDEVYWSDVTKKIHGVPKDYLPNLEEFIKFYKQGESREAITKFIIDAISKGTAWESELQIVDTDSNDIWIKIQGRADTVNGKCVRLYGSIQDIDKDDFNGKKLRDEMDRLVFAKNAANIGVWEYNFVHNTVTWDDAMYTLYGVTKENFSNDYQSWLSCVYDPDKDFALENLNRAIAQKVGFKDEFRISHSDGTIRFIGASAKIKFDEFGKPIKLIGINWDTTELKATKHKLDSTNESFEGTFKNSIVGMAIVNKNGAWTRVNNALCTNLGYSEEELLATDFQSITHKDDLETDFEYLHKANNGEIDAFQIDKRFISKTGDIVEVILTVTAIKDMEKNISHFICQIVDVSSRLKSEKQLTKLLNITNEQNNSLINFTHIVSHNLRSHSSNLTMLTDFLTVEDNEEERIKLVAMLRKASDGLNETISHLNEVVMMKANASEKMKDTNLLETITNVQKTLYPTIVEKKVKCTILIPKELFVNAIPAYLDSVFLNFFTNSLKYCSPKRTLDITISAEIFDKQIIISFKDNGLGIDLDKHYSKIFGMYKTFHDHEEARGIGLFMTKNQIEAMKGSVDIESKVDVGTTFIVSLLRSKNR